jgi:hypothetical protein
VTPPPLSLVARVKGLDIGLIHVGYQRGPLHVRTLCGRRMQGQTISGPLSGVECRTCTRRLPT